MNSKWDVVLQELRQKTSLSEIEYAQREAMESTTEEDFANFKTFEAFFDFIDTSCYYDTDEWEHEKYLGIQEILKVVYQNLKNLIQD